MRRRLTLVAAAITSMVVLAFLIPLALLVRTIAQDRALNAAELQGHALAPVVAVVNDEADITQIIQGTNDTSPRPVTIFLPNGHVVGEPAVPDRNLALAQRGRAFTTTAHGGMQVFVPIVESHPPADTKVIRVFVPNGLLRRGVAETWLLLGVLGLGLIGLAMVVNDRLARSLVQPIGQLADAAHQLGQGNLDARVEPDGPPEVVDVGRAFNRLAVRIGELLALEREAVADLSHRLRTPVTALRLDAEAVRDDEERARLAADIDELERAVDRLIRDARRPVREGVGTSTDLAATTRARVAFWAALADEQARPYTLHVPDGAYPVPVHADDLEAALDALLGNVFAHTPEGTPFHVAVETTGDRRTVLRVEDEGPGLPGAALLERGVSGAGSTGLGLDIVRRTAEASGGRIDLGRRNGGGACITVEFGAGRTT